MKGRWKIYSAAEIAWIKAHARLPRRAMHGAFTAKFARGDVSLSNLVALCKRKGWLTGRDGRFGKGMTPHNKGKPMPFHPNSAATRFKKGERRGVAMRLWKPIGTERLSHEGYVERKINDDLPLKNRWRAVHLIEWERVNGPIPKGCVLKCLNGDKTDCDPSNWEIIPRALLPRLAGGNRHRNVLAYDGAPAEVKPALLAIAKIEHAARERRES